MSICSALEARYRTKRRSFRRQFSAQRGAAAVEALLVLIFLVLVWTGIAYMGKAYRTGIEARATARGCAFYVATNSCQDVPDQCNVEQVDGDEESQDSSQDDGPTIGDLSDRADDSEDSKFTKPANEKLSTEIDKGFFRRAQSNIAASLERPELLGDKTADLSQNFSLPCNPVPQDLEEMIEDLLKESTKGIL